MTGRTLKLLGDNRHEHQNYISQGAQNLINEATHFRYAAEFLAPRCFSDKDLSSPMAEG